MRQAGGAGHAHGIGIAAVHGGAEHADGRHSHPYRLGEFPARPADGGAGRRGLPLHGQGAPGGCGRDSNAAARRRRGNDPAAGVFGYRRGIQRQRRRSGPASRRRPARAKADLPGVRRPCRRRAALRIYDGAEAAAEIECLAVRPEYRGQGRGETLYRALERRAQQANARELFALTTRSAHWFLERGFAAVAPERLPPSRRREYNRGRNSKVLRKRLKNS